MKGLFITVEGIDGAGKTTHVEALKEHFARLGRDVVGTREPGGTALGEVLRSLLLSSESPMHPETETLLIFAARREHLARIIQPALLAGRVVICDRFTDATFAYQGFGRGVDLAKLAVLESMVQDHLQPDLTLLFDVPVEVGRQRAGKTRRPDRFESEQVEFFQRVREGYLERARADPKRFRVIDAGKSIAQVAGAIEVILAELKTQ